MAKEIVKVCCVCRKSEHDGVWDKHQHHTLKLIAKQAEATHGFCPPCLDNYTMQEFGMTYAELHKANEERHT